jgi:hypothetical protein
MAKRMKGVPLSGGGYYDGAGGIYQPLYQKLIDDELYYDWAEPKANAVITQLFENQEWRGDSSVLNARLDRLGLEKLGKARTFDDLLDLVFDPTRFPYTEVFTKKLFFAANPKNYTVELLKRYYLSIKRQEPPFGLQELQERHSQLPLALSALLRQPPEAVGGHAEELMTETLKYAFDVTETPPEEKLLKEFKKTEKTIASLQQTLEKKRLELYETIAEKYQPMIMRLSNPQLPENDVELRGLSKTVLEMFLAVAPSSPNRVAFGDAIRREIERRDIHRTKNQTEQISQYIHRVDLYGLLRLSVQSYNLGESDETIREMAELFLENEIAWVGAESAAAVLPFRSNSLRIWTKFYELLYADIFDRFIEPAMIRALYESLQRSGIGYNDDEVLESVSKIAKAWNVGNTQMQQVLKSVRTMLLTNGKDTTRLDQLKPIESPVCFVCLNPSNGTCATCKTTMYCGRACQLANWEQHKRVCSK